MSHATHLHTCMLCEACCGLSVDVEGDRVVRLRGDRDDPFSRGHLCPKAAALEDVRLDPDRVLAPQRRGRDGFAPVSWSDALDEAARRIVEIQEEHGRDSVAIYLGNPIAHNYSSLMFVPLLWGALGTRSRFSATSVDQLPHMLAGLEMFGHQALVPVPDVDRTMHLFVIGANPIVSNGSAMTAPGIADRLRALRERGGRLVVVDPRRTETARVADEHHFIRPGTDVFLLLGMLRTILVEGRARLGRLTPFVRGLRGLESAVAPFTPDAVASVTGVAADVVQRLARDFASADRAACYGRVGVCTQEWGGLATWLLNVLNTVTGNLDREGGVMFTTPAVDIVAASARAGLRGHFGRFVSRVRGLPEFNDELPLAVLAEEIETPGPGRIRALVTVAGNPALSAPNGARLERALGKLDFMVSLDLYRNETTRHAHLLLPTTFGLERDHYDVLLYVTGVRNAARYVGPVFPARGETKHEWEILAELSTRIIARRRGLAQRAYAPLARAVSAVGPRRLLDLLLRTGPHRLSLRKLEAAPHGVDLGPLEPRLPRLLHTRDATIELVPPLYLTELARARERLARGAADAQRLVLVGRRQLRSNNSWMHNSQRLVKGPERCTLLMHPEDAAARGLHHGARVRLRSATGAVVVPLEVSDEMLRGVVSLPHGWGHGRPDSQLTVAATRPGASVNDVTDEAHLDGLTATAAFSAVEVEVERDLDA